MASPSSFLRSLVTYMAAAILSSCSSSPHLASTVCLTDESIKKSLSQLEKIVDNLVKPEDRVSRLIEDKCYKRAYLRGNYRIVVYGDKDSVAASMGVVRPDNGFSKSECLDRAVRDIDSLQILGAEAILVRDKTMHGELWNDQDIGPVRWLECSLTKTKNYYVSLGTMLHELNHDVRDQNCLFVAKSGESLCFSGGEKLPLRSIAKLDQFPTKKTEILPLLDSLQNVYLVSLDQPYPSLLDELNAYTVTTRNLNRLLTRLGASGISDDGKSREIFLLPLWLVYATNYLKRARTADPKAFDEVLGVGTKNRENYLKLVANAESEYRSLRAIYQKSAFRKKHLDFEENLWNEYLKSKRDLN